MKQSMSYKTRFQIAGILLAILAVSCHLPHEPGPQPRDIIDVDSELAMNVLGVLRADGQPGSSFFHLERIYHLSELDDVDMNEEWSSNIEDGLIRVKGAQDPTVYIFAYKEDTLRGRIYTHEDFVAIPGEQYMLTIEHPDYPTLRDTTEVPAVPTLDPDSVIIWNEMVYFQLRSTAETYMYDMYLLSSEDSLHYRIINEEATSLPIAFQSSAPTGEQLQIHIYGYDVNLADYLTSPMAIKPQTYHETFTSVTGGYGVFGSVSVAKVTVPPVE
jgi:hypothetical protein